MSSTRTLLILTGLFAVGLGFFFLEARRPPPLGHVEDLAALRERSDLDVVLVLIDTLRSDHLSAYGYARPTSVVMDDLASSGIRFERVRSQSTWTKTSMASLWSGAYPARVGVLRFDHAVPDQVRMPAELLQEAGFVTAGIWRNGWVANNFGFDQGFDLYFHPTPSQTPDRFARKNPSAHPLQGTDLDATEAAIEFMRTHRDQRFFLYVHYMDVHQYLYESESALFGTQYLDAYDNAIHWVDRNVGALVTELGALGLRNRTIVVVASDHGEAFYEHGREGHARNLYREVTEVPLLFFLPFRLAPGIVVEPLVANLDIWPTLLDLLGIDRPSGMQGRSLVPLIEAAARGEGGKRWAAGRPAFAQLDRTWAKPQEDPRPMISVTDGRYRLIRRLDDAPMPELFDHRIDPHESRNLAAERPEVLARLQAQITAHLDGAKTPWGEPRQVEVDAMHLEQLRALGYVIPDP